MLETEFTLGGFYDAVPLPKVDNLPEGLLDTGGNVLDSYAKIPLYGVVDVRGAVESELAFPFSSEVLAPDLATNDFAEFAESHFDGLAGIEAIQPETSANKVCGVATHSRAYAPVTAFSFTASEVFLSLGDIDGNYIDNVTGVCVIKGDADAKVNNGLILLSDVKQGSVIILGVARSDRKQHRISMRFG